MNNTQGAVESALSVFGGAVPEMAPADLPEGASPLNQDVDYSPSRVFTRGGTVGQFVFAGLFSEKLTGFVQSLPGTHAPTEVPWTNPPNAALNTPGTYASVTLNTGGFSTPTANNQSSVNTYISGAPTNLNDVLVAGTDINVGDVGLLMCYTQNELADGKLTNLSGAVDNFGNTWQPLFPTQQPSAGLFFQVLWAKMGTKVPIGSHLLITSTVTNPASVLGALFPSFCNFTGLDVPDKIQSQSGAGTAPVSGGPVTISQPEFLMSFAWDWGGAGNLASPPAGWLVQNVGFGRPLQVPVAWGAAWLPALAPPGSYTDQWVSGGGGSVAWTANFVTWKTQASGSGTAAFSQILQSNNFAFNIPTTEGVLGVQAEVSGHQNAITPDAILTAQLVMPNGALSPKTIAFQLPAVDGQAVAGTANLTWALPLTPALLNNPSFSVNLVASANGGEIVSFNVYAVKFKVWLSPAPASNFNWIKTYEQTDGEIDTLALDANGLLWDEDVDTNPGVLNNISTAIQPGSYAKSVTFDDVEYIGISDLSNGTDVPRLWNGKWLDRVSQVGPGAPPSVTTTASGSTILTITQNPVTTLPTGPHDWLLVSASPSAIGSFGAPATPGNVMMIIVRSAFVPPTSGSPATPIFKVGTNIQILGFPAINGNTVNNDPTGVSNTAFYTITSVGATVAGQQSYDWITFQVPFTTFYNQLTPGGCTIQSTLSTLTAAQQVPFLEVGNQLTITGGTSAGYDNTFVVSATPNAAQLQITQTSLTTNVANYVFTIITGVAPVLGQFVTVTGTLNGNGIFNVTNAVITSASPTSFSISLVGATISPAAETGNGIISGTIFQFDPAGTVTNPIIANSAGGLIATSGVMGVGTRQCVCIFQTRNGALTAPSPFVQFNITANAGAIVVSGIPIGPPNVTARILAFTGANGGNFFWIPQPVTVTTNGQQVTYSATLINDNVTTQVTLSFPDAVLLAGDAIDVAGNNLFEQEELGSSVGFLSYSDRLIAWQEQNKVQNFLNLSFDGGIGVLSSSIQNSSVTYPLGWTVDPVNGGGISLLVSPIFGNSFYIKNATGGTQAFYGMIEQGAYLDVFQVPIITTNTLYSVRVPARCPSGAATGNLVMDLFSPKLGTIFGSFIVPLGSMSTVMKIFTGTLLTAAFSTVPKDLLFRVYATNIPNGGDVELDRVEPFPTLEPSFQTSFTASYVSNPEAFDLVTGHFGPSQNQQPIRGGMVLFDTLYALKTKSWYSTSDTGNSEPNFWTWREVSNKIGTIGSHSYDYGEDWAFTACRAGVYFFSGGEPLKVSQEIAPVWDLINWPAAQSIWVRNDSEQRRLYVGVPIATPNIYMPEFPVNANPQTPNVVLMMSYRELNSGIAIADTPPIRSSFSGRLLAPEPARKWSFWNIASPYADFLDRANNQTPLFLCNGVANSKVYAFSPSELDDDGLPINSYYLTYGFVKSDLQDAKGLGNRRMILLYLSILAEGSGNLNVSIYVQSPQNIPYLLSSIPLSQFTLGDLESAVNCEGDRFFIRVGTNAVGSAFQMSKIVAALGKSAWSPIRGLATANP